APPEMPPREPEPVVKAPEPALAPSPVAAPQPRTVTIASGTTLQARMGETLASDRAKEGDAFHATLVQPLVIDDLVIAERGARVLGKVSDVQEAGRVKGLAKISLELTTIDTADGQRVAIRTSPFEKQAQESKGDDVKKVAIGSAIGAAIGAIAGGGKGAAIGA